MFTSLMYQLRGSGGGVESSSQVLRRNKRKVLMRFALFLAIPPLCWSFGLANRLVGYLKKDQGMKKRRGEERGGEGRGEGRGRGEREREEVRGVFMRFALFLAIPPLCWSFGLANRLVGYLKKDQGMKKRGEERGGEEEKGRSGEAEKERM